MRHLVTVFAFGALVLLTSGARAQQPQQSIAPPGSGSGFVPIVVDERSYNELLVYLRQQPYMFSAPLVMWLEQAAATAKTAAEKNKPPVPEPPPKPK